MFDLINVLKGAQGRLARPECWTQGSAARDVLGRKVDFRDPTAVCFCLLGAIWAECDDGYKHDYDDVFRDLLRTAEPAIGPSHSVADWQDMPERTHQEVLSVLSRAIKIAEMRV